MSEPHAPYDPTPLHKSKRELMEAVSRAIANFEKETGHTLSLSWGPSFGTTKDALPVRIAAGQPADVLLIVSSSLDKLVSEGRFTPASRTDVVRSRIGVGVNGIAACRDRCGDGGACVARSARHRAHHLPHCPPANVPSTRVSRWDGRDGP